MRWRWNGSRRDVIGAPRGRAAFIDDDIAVVTNFLRFQD